MYAGDYCRAEAESIHGDVFTQGGCTYLVMSSSDDQFLQPVVHIGPVSGAIPQQLTSHTL